MSFILDALKKSETERQEQTGAEFSNVPSSSGDPQSFKLALDPGTTADRKRSRFAGHPDARRKSA